MDENNLKKDLKSAYGSSRKKHYIAAAALIVILIVFALLILPNMVQREKPEMKRPAPPVMRGNDTEIKPEHIDYIVNEIGGYNLHAGIGEPEIELIADSDVYAIKIVNGKPASSPGAAASPDIRINASKAAIAEIFNSQDINKKITELYNAGAISVELLKDQATLLSKGYKSVYDAVQ